MEKLKAWIRRFPGWENLVIRTDFASDTPGEMGIFPQCPEKKKEFQDITGNRQAKISQKVRLSYAAARGEEKASDSILRFGEWVQQQDALRLAPLWGDIPDQEHVSVRDGRAAEICHPGVVRYDITLLLEYTKLYEVKE